MESLSLHSDRPGVPIQARHAHARTPEAPLQMLGGPEQARQELLTLELVCLCKMMCIAIGEQLRVLKPSCGHTM